MGQINEVQARGTCKSRNRDGALNIFMQIHFQNIL